MTSRTRLDPVYRHGFHVRGHALWYGARDGARVEVGDGDGGGNVEVGVVDCVARGEGGEEEELGGGGDGVETEEVEGEEGGHGGLVVVSWETCCG